MTPNERQALLDAAAKLGHRIAPDGKHYRCECGFVIVRKSKPELMLAGVEIHARNAVALEGRR